MFDITLTYPSRTGSRLTVTRVDRNRIPLEVVIFELEARYIVSFQGADL